MLLPVPGRLQIGFHRHQILTVRPINSDTFRKKLQYSISIRSQNAVLLRGRQTGCQHIACHYGIAAFFQKSILVRAGPRTGLLHIHQIVCCRTRPLRKSSAGRADPDSPYCSEPDDPTAQRTSVLQGLPGIFCSSDSSVTLPNFSESLLQNSSAVGITIGFSNKGIKK